MLASNAVIVIATPRIPVEGSIAAIISKADLIAARYFCDYGQSIL